MAPRSSNRSIRLTDDTWAWLKGQAEIHGLSVNAMVQDAVQRTRFGDHAHVPGSSRAKPEAGEKTRTPAALVAVPAGAKLRPPRG